MQKTREQQIIRLIATVIITNRHISQTRDGHELRWDESRAEGPRRAQECKRRRRRQWLQCMKWGSREEGAFVGFYLWILWGAFSHQSSPWKCNSPQMISFCMHPILYSSLLRVSLRLVRPEWWVVLPRDWDGRYNDRDRTPPNWRRNDYRKACSSGNTSSGKLAQSLLRVQRPHKILLFTTNNNNIFNFRFCRRILWNSLKWDPETTDEEED